MSESYHETAEAEPTSRGAGCIFFIADEQTLMFLLRDDKPFIPYPNMIDIIGGHMDPGETPLETTMRELSKELIEAETRAPMRPIVEPDCPKFAIDAVQANRFRL